jgi:septal ring factor EnvC (AmiA/AmiB activator)
MKKILVAIILLLNISAFAQSITKEYFDNEIKPLSDKIKAVQSDNGKLKSEIKSLDTKLLSTLDKVDSLQKMLNNSSKELGYKITTTADNANKKISEVDQSLSTNSLYGIIGVLTAVLLSSLLYLLLNKRQQSDKLDMVAQLSKTKSSIEESLIGEFGKHAELLDTQLHLIKQQNTMVQSSPNAEPDHSLALKVASEINLIERNVKLMDTKTKGLKQLVASVGKLKDNLAANGYEMPELLGKQFHQGMKVIVASSIPDENLEKDSEIITKVLIPQVNYNDKMIQTAQIETSKGY